MKSFQPTSSLRRRPSTPEAKTIDEISVGISIPVVQVPATQLDHPFRIDDMLVALTSLLAALTVVPVSVQAAALAQTFVQPSTCPKCSSPNYGGANSMLVIGVGH